MKFLSFLVVFVLKEAAGVIYRLNDSEYARLPQLFRLDEFDSCLRTRGDKYCYVDGQILDGDSDLHTLIREYSAYVVTHFNHSLIHWGLCVTQTCRQYYVNSTLEDALDACINATLYESHQLQAKLVREDIYCTDFDESVPYDTSDYVVGAVFLALLIVNVFGTVYDIYFHNMQKGFLSRLFLCFSVKRNWQKLVMPSGEGPDSKKSLKCLNGIKAMTTLLVVLGHSPLTNYIAIDNPQFEAEGYHKWYFQLLLNGSIVVQTFFTVSGFLRSYNILVASEKKAIGWQTLPKGILLRWLRLTPIYAAVFAFVCTWLRHIGSGPLWKPVVTSELEDCRRGWWQHLIYIDNYVDFSKCMPQAWYISGDMQLSIVGLAIFHLCRTARARKIAVAIAFVVGLVTPAAHTFFQNLHAALIISPETARNFFVRDPTFNNVYKRGHTNLVCYAMGLALGMAVYEMSGHEPTKHKKNRRLMYWATIPLGVGCAVLGMIFFIDGIEIPLMARAVYSSLIKVCFGAAMCAFIVGTLMKLDSVYRGIVEWSGWVPLDRISYCVYLIHVTVIRTSCAANMSLQHVSLYYIVLHFFGVVGVTYMLSAPCWLLVESPVAQVIKLCFEGGRKNRKESVISVKAAPPKWEDQELSSSVDTVAVKTRL